MSKKHKILAFRMGAGPELVEVEDPFQWTKKHLIGESSLIEVLYLDDGVQVFFDEEGRLKGLGVNRLIPVKAPEIAFSSNDFVINATGAALPVHGSRAVHDIHGPFVLTRHNLRKDVPESLTAADIEKYTKLLGGPPPCPQCGERPAYAGAVYCGAGCAAEAGA